MSDWEVRARPWRNAAGVESADEVAVTAFNRARGIVLMIGRMSADRLATFDPAAEWQRG